MPEKIGLVAGSGMLPVIFAREVRKKGITVVGFAVKDMAMPELADFCSRVHWFDIGEIKKALFFFIAERIKKVAMLGKIEKAVFYSDRARDEEADSILRSARSKSDYSLLNKVTDELSKRGIEVIHTVDYIPELLPSKGVLSSRKPTHGEQEDIMYGTRIAREMARLDIGQTVIVKDKAVVSIEAMEGTDRTIERAAKICNGGFTVIKVSRPNQDMRWDVPVVGPETVSLIAKSRGKALAIEEKRMFLVEKEECVEIADRAGVSLVVI